MEFGSAAQCDAAKSAPKRRMEIARFMDDARSRNDPKLSDWRLGRDAWVVVGKAAEAGGGTQTPVRSGA